MTAKSGSRRYPHSTGLGKVLPEREMLRLVRRKGMPKFTATTIVKEKDMIVELERVRLRLSGPLPRMTEARAKSYMKALTGACRSIAAGRVQP